MLRGVPNQYEGELTFNTPRKMKKTTHFLQPEIQNCTLIIWVDYITDDIPIGSGDLICLLTEYYFPN